MKKQTQTNKIEWEEVELQEVCEVKKGKSITKKTITKGDVPVIAGGQQPAYYHNVANRTGETITVSGSGAYAGFVAYFNIPIFASDCTTIQTKNKEISIRFIYSFLKSNQNEIYKLQKGIAQPHIYPKDLAILKINLPFSNGSPDLKEQERIVSILEKAEKVKAKGNNAGKLLDEYLKSVFNEMFYNKGFEIRRLGEICDVRDGTHASPKYVQEGYPLITSKNLTNGFIDFSEINLISKSDFDEVNKRSKVDPGDIIMPMIGTIGNPVIVPKGIREFAIKNVALIKFRNPNVSNIYVKSILDSPYFKQVTAKNNRGGTQKFIALGDIRNIPIPLPPLPLQQKFAKIVEHVEGLKENVKKTKQNSEELFNSLMTKAFRGEL
jgi:type I restriction enzyme, S subunit